MRNIKSDGFLQSIAFPFIYYSVSFLLKNCGSYKNKKSDSHNENRIFISLSYFWEKWVVMDSNHRRHSQQIYSLPHLATLVTTQKLLICELSLFDKSFVLKSECKGSVFFSFHQIFLHLFSLFSQKTSFFPKIEGFCPYRAPCWLLLYPGCCPGLRASALSGREEQSVLLPLQGGGLELLLFYPLTFITWCLRCFLDNLLCL